MTADGRLSVVKDDSAESSDLPDLRIAVGRRVGDSRELAVALFFRAVADTSALLDLLAGITVTHGEPRKAARFFGAAERLRTPISDFASATSLVNRDRAIAAARAMMGDRAFEAQYDAGRAMSVEEIVEYVRELEVTDPGDSADLPDRLTPRELEILLLIAGRYSNSEIAKKLVLSVRTVERHISNIFGKTGLTNRREVIEYCHRHKLSRD